MEDEQETGDLFARLLHEMHAFTALPQCGGSNKEHSVEKDLLEKENIAYCTKIMLFVLITVFLHGIWTHLDDAEKMARCKCADLASNKD